jgi:hypothetical protein
MIRSKNMKVDRKPFNYKRVSMSKARKSANEVFSNYYANANGPTSRASYLLHIYMVSTCRGYAGHLGILKGYPFEPYIRAGVKLMDHRLMCMFH